MTNAETNAMCDLIVVESEIELCVKQLELEILEMKIENHRKILANLKG